MTKQVHLGDFFPDFAERALHFSEVMVGMSMVLVFTGTVVKVWRGSQGDVSQMLSAIVSAGIIAAIIPVFPDWINDLQLMMHSLVDEMGSNPSESHERFARIIGSAVDGEEKEEGFWSIMWSDNGGFGKAILYALIFLAAKIASALMWLAMILQQALVNAGPIPVRSPG